MDTKIQELTEKIYKEGVEKGKEEANRIVAGAKEQKEIIVSEAENEAKQIIFDAEKQAEELKRNTKAELRLFASQAIEGLKSEITNLVTDQIVSNNVKMATTDALFMQNVIRSIAVEWAKNESLTIQTVDAESLTGFFREKASELLQQGVKIEQVNSKKTSFTLVPADGAFKINFGEDELIAYFKEFLRPQLIEILF